METGSRKYSLGKSGSITSGIMLSERPWRVSASIPTASECRLANGVRGDSDLAKDEAKVRLGSVER